ncbi:tetratricopeptide repeat protein [Psychrobacter sp. FDAARGOS_221]|uniref:tetratricopeptide repeat protein n=1 Tax=Psychrobacter sp. FDAARGOS_221 TaxID=1975705 RepID=UPI000BB59DB4|nr:tetratricopeptide repeat protein [Psychrobacter sp. FDAARGOS_221]PNK59810.1 sel1 repeat family protein [Psychrobacter sp. FDAARGOS_221]
MTFLKSISKKLCVSQLMLIPLILTLPLLGHADDTKNVEVELRYDGEPMTGADYYQLAFMYYNGLGVEESEEKGFDAVLKAAQLNHLPALNKVGAMYEFAMGTERDLDKAFYWYQKAADAGSMKGQYNVGIVYLNGNRDAVANINPEERYKIAFEFLTKSANQNYAPAQNALGNMYKNGMGVEQNESEAIEWWRKAAYQNDVNAQLSLELLAFRNKGVADSQKLIQAYREEAEAGDKYSQYKLGVINYKGINQPVNTTSAILWLGQSCDNGLTQACILLRNMGIDPEK